MAGPARWWWRSYRVLHERSRTPPPPSHVDKSNRIFGPRDLVSALRAQIGLVSGSKRFSHNRRTVCRSLSLSPRRRRRRRGGRMFRVPNSIVLVRPNHPIDSILRIQRGTLRQFVRSPAQITRPRSHRRYDSGLCCSRI